MSDIEVVVADGDRLVRAGLRMLLERDGDIAVVGEAARGEQVVTIARRLHPDVVVMDAGIPGCGALWATRLIFETGLGHVLLVASRTGDAEVLEAIHAGAYGVLPRDSEPVDLLRAVRVIAGGGALVTPGALRDLAADVLAHRPQTAAALEGLEALTGRQREVLALVGLGFTNEQIAGRLEVAAATVKTHVGRVLAKLDARDRAELVTLAYESGLVKTMGRAAA